MVGRAHLCFNATAAAAAAASTQLSRLFQSKKDIFSTLFFYSILSSLQCKIQLQLDSKFTIQTALELVKQLAKTSGPSVWHGSHLLGCCRCLLIHRRRCRCLTLAVLVLMLSLQAMPSLHFTSFPLTLAIIRAECDYFSRISPLMRPYIKGRCINSGSVHMGCLSNIR